ncbi:MAG: class I adenylate-forming enzyme family protein [Thermomicrobiales bacterium]
MTEFVRVETLVDDAAARLPDHLALICGERCWTYAQLRVEMDRRAALLVATGLQPGDVVTTVATASDDVGITLLACCRAGLTLFPLSPRLTVTELAPLIARADTKLTLTEDGSPHPAYPEGRTLPLDLPGVASEKSAAEAARRSATGDTHAVVVIQTTSSTTGSAPKLVATPHRMLTWRRLTPAWWELPSDVHCLAQGNFSPPRGLCEVLAQCGTVVFPRDLDPEPLEAEMAAHRVTAIRTVPAVMHLLAELRHPPPTDLTLRIVRSGAAPLPATIRRAIERRYGATVVQTYSSTEGDSMMGTPPDGGPPGTIGRPYPGVAARIVDEDGQDVPDGATGELVIRSPGMMSGYLADPAATARTLRDGWLWTGDLARRDAEGFYYLEGRRALRINVGGFKVAPEEVEAVLMQHPGVREAVALAMPDAKRGEVGRAVIVPRGDPPPVRELRRHCRERLAGYKVPRHWEFRDALPRSPLGKVLRRLL